ncbi:MAG: 4Fe-4S dicluster domain-containing protein [Candidatus Zixiibacteriota bacterium]
MAGKKLFVDIEKFRSEGAGKTYCSYYYHPNNTGLDHIWAIAAAAVVCRRCEDKPCARACPKDALEVDESGRFNRYSMRCISCKSCASACPFGVIFDDILPYVTSKCDYCLERLEEGEDPLCVQSEPSGAVSYLEIEADEDEHYYALGENVVVHVLPWNEERIKERLKKW